jgi:hypothetical protein
VDRRGDLGEDMMAAGANVDAERVGGALVAEAWADKGAIVISSSGRRWCLHWSLCVKGSEHVLL